MTKKDYELIALAIAELRGNYPDGEPVSEYDKGFAHGTKQGKGKRAQWYARCVTGRACGLGAFWCRTLREVSQELNSH